MGISVHWLRDTCGAFPGSTEDIKWGADLCFCVGEKMYAVTSHGAEEHSVSLKTTPAVFADLIQHESVDPAPYLARNHWILVRDHTLLSQDELATLLRGSYELVLGKLSKKRQREITGG